MSKTKIFYTVLLFSHDFLFSLHSKAYCFLNLRGSNFSPYSSWRGFALFSQFYIALFCCNRPLNVNKRFPSSPPPSPIAAQPWLTLLRFVMILPPSVPVHHSDSSFRWAFFWYSFVLLKQEIIQIIQIKTTCN